MTFKVVLLSLASLIVTSCLRKQDGPSYDRIPTVAFLDAFEDPTIAKAKDGFFKSLSDHGYSPSNGSLKVLYKNAQGNAQTMNLALSYLLSRNPNLIATSTTVATVAASQRTSSVPVFMMVSPNPLVDGLETPTSRRPNLFGVYEDADYIDTAVGLVKEVLPRAQRIATIYSQSESQSQNSLDRMKATCLKLGFELHALPVNNSSDTRLVVSRLMEGHPDAFFALPDNSVFASFESILAVCNARKVPIFTSEEGLVERGAVAAFGASITDWGYQCGTQAALFLDGHKKDFRPERVARRLRLYNESQANFFSISMPKNLHMRSVNKPAGPQKSQGRKLSSLWVDAILGGLCLSFLAFGIFLSLRIFQIPDITTDASFTLGGVITSLGFAAGITPFLALIFAFLGGACSGAITGIISTRFKINALLAGILVMTGLYSVNLALLGRANKVVESAGYGKVFVFVLVIFVSLALYLFLKTDYGLAMRASGSSPEMARSVGIKVENMQVAGLAIANGLTAIAGYLTVQLQGFVDVGMGSGIVLTGLGSVLIADSVSQGPPSLVRLLLLVVGSIVFQLIVASALSAGADPVWIKLITSSLVLGAVILPKIFKR